MEPAWPVLRTDVGPPPRTEFGWARRVGPDEPPPDGLPDPQVMEFGFELDPFQKQVRRGTGDIGCSGMGWWGCVLSV